jgi:DNA sulfur modification protein DndE
MLPNRVSLSTNATGKLRYMKQNTGLTPNILSRIAIMKAIEAGGSLRNAGVQDSEGQVLSRDVLFGDYAEVYDVMLAQYVHENEIDIPLQDVIPALIEIGVHKMGHVKKIQDLVMDYRAINDT